MNTLVKYLIVFFVSMVPLIELRGAVPIGTGLGLPWHLTLIVAIIGNCVPIPIILFFIKKVLTWMRGVQGRTVPENIELACTRRQPRPRKDR